MALDKTLTETVFPCYAASDRELAAAIAAFLERGDGVCVFFDEGELRPGEDLVSKAREARTVGIVVVLLSRSSVPSPWPRAQWEDALIGEPRAEGVRIAFVRCDDYAPPRVFLPQFDGRTLAGRRELKRWVRNHEADYLPPELPPHPGLSAGLEILTAAVADRAGSETVASASLAFEFARASRSDFDEILRLACGNRTLAALAGDLGAQLGLRLDGDLENNLERLRVFCAERRFLLLLDDVRSAAAGEFVFGGRCSTLLCAEAGPAVDSPDEALLTAQRVLLQSEGAPWAEVCRQARTGRRLLRERQRIAELFEMMEQWRTAAEARGDRPILDESLRELVWILEGWGRTGEARRLEYRRATEFDEQMFLPLGDGP
jgi:hypothetical protein